VPESFWLEEYDKKAALPDALAQTGRGNTFRTVEFLYVAKQIIELLDLHPKVNLLDVGCANGLLDIVLSACCGSIIAVEPVAALVDRARQNLAGCSNVRVEVGHGARIPTSVCTFDRVLMLGVLQLISPKEIQEVFEELRRVTRPGGRIVIGSIAENAKKRAFLDPYLDGVRKAVHLSEEQKHQIVTRNQNAHWYDFEDLAEKWQALGGRPSRHPLGTSDPDHSHRFHLKVILPT
jgi:cyclopropane fatty-acyl-phospholipid synthase-like methyltransferase